MEELYNETLFLLSEKPTNTKLLTIVALHSANTHLGLQLKGLNDETLDEEFHGLPSGWDIGEAGVHSFQYRNHNQEQFHFKFVTSNQSSWLSVFAIKTVDTNKLYSF